MIKQEEQDSTMLRVAVDMRERVAQKNRIAFGNRLLAIEQERDQASPRTVEFLKNWNARMVDMEEALDEDIRELAEDYPIIDEMISVKGVGHMTAAKVVCFIDIEKCTTISKLWRYAGYAVIDGKAERPVRGEKLHYNKRLKTACYVLGTSLMRSRGPYKDFYDKMREKYEVDRPDWTKLHKHNAALRKMIKLFLAHLWMRWREMEQLDTEEPYIIATDNNHTHIIRPEEYGWRPYGEQP